jgi:hypothetical protein
MFQKIELIMKLYIFFGKAFISKARKKQKLLMMMMEKGTLRTITVSSACICSHYQQYWHRACTKKITEWTRALPALLIVAQMLSKFPAIFRIQTFVQY